MKTGNTWPILLSALLLLSACGPMAGPTPAGTLPPAEPPSPTAGAMDSPVPAASDTPEMGSGADPAAVAISIEGFAFSLAELTISAGTTVTWTNNDAAPHTVTADDDTWGSSRLSRGETFSFTFDQPGTYAYHCGLHPAMAATIVVTP